MFSGSTLLVSLTTNTLSWSFHNFSDNGNTITQYAYAQDGDGVQTEQKIVEETREEAQPDQEETQPLGCEKTTAGCPESGDEVEGTVAPPTTGQPSSMDVVPSTTPAIPPEGIVLPYTCSTTIYDKPTCSCVGIDDCNKLRKSGECKTGTVPTGSGEVGRCPGGGK